MTTGDVLHVDFSSITIVPNTVVAELSTNYSFNILYNGVVCGRYYVDNGAKKHIRVDFYVNQVTSIPVDSRFVITPLTSDMFTSVVRLNLNYSTSNFSTFKHMYPRLTSVSFN